MVRVFSTTGPLQGRDFVLGVLSGIILTLAGVIWFAQLGLFPKESQALILSADYRLSRNEMQLREQVRYLEHELDVLRRARSSTAGYTGRTGS